MSCPRQVWVLKEEIILAIKTFKLIKTLLKKVLSSKFDMVWRQFLLIVTVALKAAKQTIQTNIKSKWSLPSKKSMNMLETPKILHKEKAP